MTVQSSCAHFRIRLTAAAWKKQQYKSQMSHKHVNANNVQNHISPVCLLYLFPVLSCDTEQSHDTQLTRKRRWSCAWEQYWLSCACWSLRWTGRSVIFIFSTSSERFVSNIEKIFKRHVRALWLCVCGLVNKGSVTSDTIQFNLSTFL